MCAAVVYGTVVCVCEIDISPE